MLQLKKLDLKFLSEENGKPCHKHILNGEEVPGCTSVSGLFQDDGWKFAWPPKLMSEVIWAKAKEKYAKCHSMGIVDFDGIQWTWGELEAILKNAKGAWRQKRDKSADTGKIAHKDIENYIAGNAMPVITDPEVSNCIREFLDWEFSHKPEWLGSEVQVGSERYQFAGILDAVARIDGKIVLVDFKTSAAIKDDYTIQLAGLCICLEEMGLTVDVRSILHLPKEGHYEFRPIRSDLAKDKIAFLVGLEFFRHKNMFAARCKE